MDIEKMNELYCSAINEAYAKVDAISKPEEQAKVLVSIAQALASTGLIQANVNEVKASDIDTNFKDDDVKEKKKVTDEKTASVPSREDLKRKPPVKKSEQKPGLKTKPVKTEDEWEPETPEWTEEAEKHLAKELDFVNNKIVEYGTEEYEYQIDQGTLKPLDGDAKQEKIEELGDAILSDCFKEYTDGTYKDLDGLNPLNIKAFVIYIQSLEEAAEKEDSKSCS